MPRLTSQCAIPPILVLNDRPFAARAGYFHLSVSILSPESEKPSIHCPGAVDSSTCENRDTRFELDMSLFLRYIHNRSGNPGQNLFITINTTLSAANWDDLRFHMDILSCGSHLPGRRIQEMRGQRFDVECLKKQSTWRRNVEQHQLQSVV
jgi:hypothetical protein